MFRHTLNIGRKRQMIHARLPWWYFIGPGIVANKYEGYQRTARFRGPDIDSLDDPAVLNRMVRLNDALHRLDGRYALHIEAQRIRIMGYPGDDLSEEERRAAWPDVVSWMMDEERREWFNGDQHFETRQFITFSYKCAPKSQRRARNVLVIEAEPEPGLGYGEELSEFIRETDGIKALLAELCQECEWLTDAETLEYLHSTVSTSRHPVKPSMGKSRVDHDVADCRVVGGAKPMLGDCHLRTVTIANIPETAPDILGALNDLGFEYRWSVRWLPYDYGKGLEVIQDRRADWGMFAMPFKHAVAQYLHLDFNEDENATSDSMVQDAGDVIHAAKGGGISIGKLQVNITVWHPDKKTVNKRVAAVIHAAQKAGMVAKRYGIAAVDAWLGTLPGNIHADARQPIRTSINLSHLIPFASVWSGIKRVPFMNPHVPHPPAGAIGICSGDNSTPYNFALHHGDLAHLLLLGPSGSGKSTFLNWLRSQYRRYGARVVSIDVWRSADVATRLMGGTVYYVGEIGGIGFQPLARIDEPNWRAWAVEWVTGLLRARNVTVTTEVDAAVSRALADVARNAPEDRTLTELSVALPAELKPAINHYCVDGDFGNLLDDTEERIGSADCITFEMGALNGQDISGPVLEYLFHFLETVVFDGTPTLFVVDEAWRFIKNPQFVERFDRWLRMLRRRKVTVVFATQFLRDALDGPLAGALSETCPNRILLANDKAAEPDIRQTYVELGFNAAEIEMVSRMVPKRDYYHTSPAGKRRFRLGLGPVGLQLCGSSYPDALLRCDELARHIDVHGGPCFAELWFRHPDIGLDWAADLVRADRAMIPEVPPELAMAAE
jgi:type IV secretory pathway VirB4 component